MVCRGVIGSLISPECEAQVKGNEIEETNRYPVMKGLFLSLVGEGSVFLRVLIASEIHTSPLK